MSLSPAEFNDQALYPHQMDRWEVFEGKSQAQTDDGVGASSLDQSESDPTAATGYGGGMF